MATQAVERSGLAVADTAGAARWRRRRALNAWGWRAFLTIVGLMLFGPLVILVLFSFNDSNILAFPLEGVTTKWYTEALTDPVLRTALKNSFQVFNLDRFGFGTVWIRCHPMLTVMNPGRKRICHNLPDLLYP